MNLEKKMKIFFPIVVRVILGAIFVFAGISKLIDPQTFLKMIQQLGIIPSWLIIPSGTVVVQAEIWLGFAMIAGFRTRLAIKGLSGLIVVFLTVVSFAIIHGGSTECGCFGPFVSERVGPGVVVRDYLLLGSCFWLFYTEKSRSSPQKLGKTENTKRLVSD